MTMTTWLVSNGVREMHARLKAEPDRLVTMPGTLALVDLLHDDPNVEVGVLTGNWEKPASPKWSKLDSTPVGPRCGAGRLRPAPS